MPTFNVLLGLALNGHYEVEADDAGDASERAMDLFRNAYDLPHDGDIVIDFVGLTDAEGEDEEKGESVSGPDGTGQ